MRSFEAYSSLQKDRERGQAFSIFATRVFEQQVLAAYQEFNTRRAVLQNFRTLSTASSRGTIPVDPILESTTILFREEDIALHSTRPINTSGAFSDLYLGEHRALGKVAVKRLRFGMAEPNALYVSAEEKLGVVRKSNRSGILALPERSQHLARSLAPVSPSVPRHSSG